MGDTINYKHLSGYQIDFKKRIYLAISVFFDFICFILQKNQFINHQAISKVEKKSSTKILIKKLKNYKIYLKKYILNFQNAFKMSI